ncbi:hypothetical protein LHJ74_00140 [Streptomyces sp. N2-109]|uniref:Uncharacterized protein n=1 Tax=Streptomyces gossypii TaxID=2883101 RepID=A0ABT2JKX8_9ACTN|nr:hypothetical protein [Streptomyces gossypii]MCT2588371.1 hypothetical protein [Streptomyces gossypii]
MTETTDADEERLRRALTLIGEEAGRGASGPPPRPVWWRTPGRITAALVTAAVVAAGVLAVGLGMDSGEDSADPGAAGQGQTRTEGIACSRFIAEGIVVRVREADTPGRIILTFDVQDRIKPAHGEDHVRLNLFDPAEVDPQDAFRPGEHILLMVQQRRDENPAVFRGEELDFQRSMIKRDLPEARRTECPPYWRENSTITPPPVPGDA